MGQIYKVTNRVNGKSYIGLTSRYAADRWREHKRDWKAKQNILLYRAFAKYGLDNFDFEVLETCENEILGEREIYWISFYDSYNCGYNMTRGGNGGGRKVLPDEVQKLWEDGLDVKAIAERLNVNMQTVREYLHTCPTYSRAEGIRRASFRSHWKTEKALRKAVEQYDINGIFLSSFDSLTAAAEATGITLGSLSKVANINEKAYSTGGYRWKLQSQPSLKPFPLTYKPVVQYTKEGRYISSFPSQSHAASLTGINEGTIKACIKRNSIGKQFTWRYAEGRKRMYTLDFINNHNNWREILTAPPYSLKIQEDGEYFLLKYSQLISDFSLPIVQECRGAIFTKDKSTGKYICVCYPFSKFFNYGENNCHQIDWSTASVQEKIDGSLIKMWYHDGSWHVSTNGTIHASSAGTGGGTTFFGVVCKAIPRKYCLIDLFDALDKEYTYMFELVSPETRVTIEYKETALYYLGARNMYTLQEVSYPEETNDAVFFECVKLPKRYPLHTIEQCIEVAQSMGADEEGFVVCDGAFNRIKIKSPEYLMAARVRNNNVITVKRVVEAMRAGYIDDLYAYLPDYHPYIDDILNAYNYIAMKCDHAYQAVVERIKENPSLRLFEAVQVEDPEYQDYCFKRISGRVLDEYDYLDNRISFGNIVDWIKTEMTSK